MSLQYKIVSKFYGLLDVVYFNREETSPRRGMLNIIPDGKLKMLEICVGTAENSIIVAQNRPNVDITGVDLSEEMLKIAEEKIEKKQITNIKTLAMDATNMDFEDNYFDVVLISLVLHEVNETIRKRIMNEARKVVKNKGKIIIVEWDRPKKIIEKFLFLIIELLEPKGFEAFLRLDLKEYMKKFSLKTLSEKKCAYTRIIELTKE